MSLAHNPGDPTPEALQADIARANLLRMRGDYKGAVDQCLSVLKRAPDDHDAHILIGDIYAEQGDLGQATQWYELALDLMPKDAATQSKLSAVRERQRQRDAASAAEQIGLPSDRPSYGLYAGVLTVVFAAVAIGAFLLGQKQDSGRPSMQTVAAVAPNEAPATNPEPEQTPAPDTGTSTAPQLPEEDRQLAAALQSRVSAGTTVIAAQEDPRDRTLIATVTARPEDPDRSVAAEVGQVALNHSTTSPRVAVRIVKGGKVAYIATVERERMMIAIASQYPEGPEGLAAYLAQMLSNEWPIAGAADSAAGTSGSTAQNGLPSPP